MSQFNQIPNCGTSAGGNTGTTRCPFQINIFRGAFLTPKGFKIPQSTVEDPELLFAFLVAAAQAASPLERIYPIHGFKGMPENNTEARVTQTFGFGEVIPVREGNYAPTFQHYDGGMCLHKELMKFNGAGYDFLFYDLSKDKLLIGMTAVEAGIRYLKALPSTSFYARPVVFPDGTNVAQYLLDFTFPTVDLNTAPGFVSTLGFDITAVKGLENVLITPTGSAADSVTVKLTTSCGGVDLYDLYEAEFSNEEAWVLTTPAGAAIPIESIASDDSGKSWVITTVDPLPTAYNLNLANPTVLAAAPVEVEGYEGIMYKKTA